MVITLGNNLEHFVIERAQVFSRKTHLRDNLGQRIFGKDNFQVLSTRHLSGVFHDISNCEVVFGGGEISGSIFHEHELRMDFSLQAREVRLLEVGFVFAEVLNDFIVVLHEAVQFEFAQISVIRLFILLELLENRAQQGVKRSVLQRVT